jgi:hypothetical protein
MLALYAHRWACGSTTASSCIIPGGHDWRWSHRSSSSSRSNNSRSNNSRSNNNSGNRSGSNNKRLCRRERRWRSRRQWRGRAGAEEEAVRGVLARQLRRPHRRPGRRAAGAASGRVAVCPRPLRLRPVTRLSAALLLSPRSNSCVLQANTSLWATLRRMTCVSWSTTYDPRTVYRVSVRCVVHGVCYLTTRILIWLLVGVLALWGRSMGAATAIMYTATDPSIACLILDSPFSSLSQLAQELVQNFQVCRYPISSLAQLPWKLIALLTNNARSCQFRCLHSP